MEEYSRENARSIWGTLKAIVVGSGVLGVIYYIVTNL